MAILTLADVDGNEIPVPERLSGDGPEVRFTICDAGQFLDLDANSLTFISRPDPPPIERVEVLGEQDGGIVGEVSLTDWAPTEAELELARKEAKEMRAKENDGAGPGWRWRDPWNQALGRVRI